MSKPTLEQLVHTGREYRSPASAPARPGAMDAFRLPSIANGRQIDRARPTAQLVGTLKARANQGRD